MITVSYPAAESVSAPTGRGKPACPPPPVAARPLRLALCSFAPPPAASQLERMQARLALRFMQQQLAGLGAEVSLLAPVDATSPADCFDRVGAIDALVVFPAFCASPSALAAVLDGADRPGLVMALSNACDDDAETPEGGGALAALWDGPADGASMGRKWIGGGLFDVRAWYEAGQWVAALYRSAALARGDFSAPN